MVDGGLDQTIELRVNTALGLLGTKAVRCNRPGTGEIRSLAGVCNRVVESSRDPRRRVSQDLRPQDDTSRDGFAFCECDQPAHVIEVVTIG